MNSAKTKIKYHNVIKENIREMRIREKPGRAMFHRENRADDVCFVPARCLQCTAEWRKMALLLCDKKFRYETQRTILYSDFGKLQHNCANL